MDEQFYREQILDHYREPRGQGTLDPCDALAAVTNPMCGDEVAVTLRIAEGVLSEFAFVGRGCAISQAATSMLTEELVGQSIEQIRAMGLDDMRELLGIELSPARVRCAVLGLGAVQEALGVAE